MTVEQYAEQLNKRLAGVATKEELTAFKAQLEELNKRELVSKEDFDKLDKDIDEMSKALAKLTENKAKNKATIKAAINAQIEKNKSLPEAQRQYNIAMKADNLFNIQVIDGGTWDEDEANIDTQLLTESAIETGFAPDLRRELTLLNEMRDATPLRIGDALKWIEPTDANGKPLTVKEANEKPIGTVKYVRKSKESTKIAIYFQVAEEFLNRADFLMTAINTHFRELLTETLEEKAFDATGGILSYGTAYVNPTGYAVPDPNKLDAISAVASSMKALKYKPSHVVLNTADIAMMFGEKGIDGHYSLYNGNSIKLIDGSPMLIVGTTMLKIIEVNDDLIDLGDFAVIDWSKLKYGLGSIRLKSDPYTNMRDNILNFLMEAPFAVARPSNYPYAVVVTDFDTVENAIEEPVTP